MAGRLGGMDQRVTFQEKSDQDDGQGGRENETWGDISTAPTMWAKVITRDGSEGDEGELRPANRYQIDVTIRNREGLTEQLSLVWRGRRYNIKSLEPFNYRAEFRKLVCEGGVPL